jgi:hypothetical protein
MRSERMTVLLTAIVAVLSLLALAAAIYIMHPGAPMLPPTLDCAGCHAAR